MKKLTKKQTALKTERFRATMAKKRLAASLKTTADLLRPIAMGSQKEDAQLRQDAAKWEPVEPKFVTPRFVHLSNGRKLDISQEFAQELYDVLHDTYKKWTGNTV